MVASAQNDMATAQLHQRGVPSDHDVTSAEPHAWVSVDNDAVAAEAAETSAEESHGASCVGVCVFVCVFVCGLVVVCTY